MDNYRLITDQELKSGYFFLTHREKIKKASLIILALIVAAIYVKLVFSLVELLQSESFQEIAAQVQQNKNWASYHSQRAPKMISTSAVQYLPLGGKRYNLVAFVINPNENWAVSDLDYSFIVNNETLPAEHSFLNPGEERMIIKTGYESTRAITNLSVKINDVSWRRFEDDSPAVTWDIRDIVFTPASNKIVDDKVVNSPAKVEWSAQNLSLYNFWEVGFEVALFNGDKLVGINEVKVHDFMSLESKDLDAIWLNDLPRVTKTAVYPVLNWLDKDNLKDFYIEPDSEERVNL